MKFQNYWHANSKYFCAIWQASAGSFFHFWFRVIYSCFRWRFSCLFHFSPFHIPPDFVPFIEFQTKLLLSSKQHRSHLPEPETSKKHTKNYWKFLISCLRSVERKLANWDSHKPQITFNFCLNHNNKNVRRQVVLKISKAKNLKK